MFGVKDAIENDLQSQQTALFELLKLEDANKDALQGPESHYSNSRMPVKMPLRGQIALVDVEDGSKDTLQSRWVALLEHKDVNRDPLKNRRIALLEAVESHCLKS